ncbi:MAG: succinylglutamate desuccinylase/aspartoacylase family protein [Chloroflexota bacterium]
MSAGALPFDLGAVAPGRRLKTALEVPTPDGDAPARLPLLVARGREAGPTIVVLAGVHGDEYEGMAAVRAVFDRLDPGRLRGAFLGVPVCHPAAFAAGTRESPLDGLNLARVFPGRSDGAVTERIARVIATALIRLADFLIDLHSSGRDAAMPLLVGYDATDDAAGRQSYEAARRFGVPTIWGHPAISPGRTISEANRLRVPWLYTECPGGGWLHPDTAAAYARGVLNVMASLHAVDGEAPVAPITDDLIGDGDVDRSLAAPASGFLSSRVSLLERVRAGDVLGQVEDPWGDVVARIVAPADGVVVLRRNTARVMAGDIAYLLTGERSHDD